MNNQKRKYDGPIRNRDRTKLKLLNAVGDLIKEKGYTGLRINKIAERAKVDRKTLYDCFGTVENLIETYIKGKDYYLTYHDQAEELAKEYTSRNANELTQNLLLKQLEIFSLDEEMQKILLWHMSEKNSMLSEINEERERVGSIFMSLCTPQFEGTPIDIRGRIALIIGGIYFLVLYSKNTVGSFCELDLNTEKGMESIRVSIVQMIDEAFQLASKQKPSDNNDRK